MKEPDIPGRIMAQMATAPQRMRNHGALGVEAVNQKDILVLGLVAAGACAGIITFSRLLGWLLRNYHDLMVAVLTGLMLGSLRKVWPWKETLVTMVDPHGRLVPVVQSNVLPSQWSGELAAAFFLMVIGLVVVLFLDRLSEPTERE